MRNDTNIEESIDQLIALGYSVQEMVNSLTKEKVEELPKCVEEVYYLGLELIEFAKDVEL